MLKIVEVPNKILTQPVKKVLKIDAKIKNLILEMEKTLISQTDPQGVGLAAPQVGSNLAIFIIKPTLKSKTEVFINPQIIKTFSTKKINKKTHSPLFEGCLSIPHIWGPIKRAKTVLLRYQTLEGLTKEKLFTGFKAIIIQHEVDHLHGILFTQRSLEQKQPLYEEKNGQLVKTKI